MGLSLSAAAAAKRVVSFLLENQKLFHSRVVTICWLLDVSAKVDTLLINLSQGLKGRGLPGWMGPSPGSVRAWMNGPVSRDSRSGRQFFVTGKGCAVTSSTRRLHQLMCWQNALNQNVANSYRSNTSTRAVTGNFSGCTAYLFWENIILSPRDSENVLFCALKYMAV
jgi:hypothetical protein